MGFSNFNHEDFFLSIASGNEPGFSVLRKFGNNPDIDVVSGFEDITECCPNYTYPTSAATNYLSSSDAGDTQEITIVGLDANWNEQTVTQNVNGQTKTEIGSGKTWIRVYQAYNSNGTDITGDVYIYEDDTVTDGIPDTISKVKARINNGNNQSLMALYTVPNGKTGYIFQLKGSISSKKDVKSVMKLFIREFGKVFRVQDIFGLQGTGDSSTDRDYLGYIKCPAKTDIKISADTNTNDTAISASFEIILIDD